MTETPALPSAHDAASALTGSTHADPTAQSQTTSSHGQKAGWTRSKTREPSADSATNNSVDS